MSTATRRSTRSSKSTSSERSKSELAPNEAPEVEFTPGPEGVSVDVGIGSIEINTDGTIGLGISVPLPTAPGVSINGGVVINPKTGEIESVSIGADFLDTIEIEVSVEGCDIVTTTSIKIPKTNFSVSTSVQTEIPGCKPQKPNELPKSPNEMPEPLKAPSINYPGLDPYDPNTFPPLPINCDYIISLSWPHTDKRRNVVAKPGEIPWFTKRYCYYSHKDYYIQGYSYNLPADMAKRILYSDEFCYKIGNYTYRKDLLECFQAVTGLSGIPSYTYHTRNYK